MTDTAPNAGEPPRRGTRPRNRRDLIVAAAADLFARHGYSRVGMNDLAEAVAISRPALYRHFANKQELLAEVISRAIARTIDVLSEADSQDLDSMLRAVARAVLDYRGAGVLWQRDGRHLPAEHRAPLRERNKQIGLVISELLMKRRPELTESQASLLTWCALAVATSVSFHDIVLPEDEYEELLATLLHRVATAELPAPPAEPANGAAEHPALTTQSRWEQLLDTAAKLFAEHGYGSVGMDDIADAVGITGPSVYNHFRGKAEILATAMQRGAEWLRYDMQRVLTSATSPADALHELLRADAAFVLEHNHLVDLLISEASELSEESRRHIRRAARDYNGDWTHLLRAVHPDLDEVHATIHVQAVFNAINNVARSPRLRRIPGVRESLVSIGAALLSLPPH